MGILGKSKHKHGRLHRRAGVMLAALVVAVSMAFAPAAMADMQGVDMSNWQCGADVYNMQADFIVVGTTWGTGQVNNNCLVSGVNTDANRMIYQAQASGKKFGLYHYAMGGSPEGEAQFFYLNTGNYWRHGIVALDWEMDDNPAWGDWDWVRRFMSECERLSGGVRPLLYTGPVAGTIPQDIRDRYGLWIAQYANMSPTGYQANPWMIGAYGEAMRQYSGTGVVNTWSPIDLNVFRGDAWQWDLYANPDDKGAAGLPDVKPTPQPTTTPTVDLDALATRTIRGDFGNDPARRQALGSNYAAVMDIVNRRLGGSTGASTAVDCGDVCVTVGVGDTLSSIAASNGGSWDQYTGYRSGNPALIYPGETVCRRGGTAAAPAYAGGGRYVVRAGDTLGGIAAYYGVNMYSIHGYRSGNPALIYPGETLYW